MPNRSINITFPSRSTMKMQKKMSSSLLLLISCLLILVAINGEGLNLKKDEEVQGAGKLVKREDMKEIVSTEYGNIVSVDVEDGIGRSKKYQIQFISLDPNSLFLPAILHSDMVFYVQTGSGRLSYTEEGEMREVKLRRGDAYSLKSGTIFLMQSSLDPERQRFRINAIFSDSDEELHKENSVGAYSNIHELFHGFDKRILQAAFQVSEDMIEEIINASRTTPPIVHSSTESQDEKKDSLWETKTTFVKSFLGFSNADNKSKKKHKMTKAFNFFEEDPDVKNCNGWSTMVTSKNLHSLKGSNIGVFMVNLSTSAMVGPHWNPTASEIGVVLEGRGMVRVVCPSNLTRPGNAGCRNTRFLVEEGDIFVIPRYHPMAQMSFNNETLVFMGFATSTRNNHPQFLAGEASVLRALKKRVLEVALNVNTTTITKLLDARKGSTLLDCVSCAEEERAIERREVEDHRKQEEEGRRREEEEKKREEERRRKEEEEKKREEEESRAREEEERRKKEEEKREEEERREREEEERRRKEEEEKKREEEEIREREEEERRRQEEEEKKREEKERREREEEERQRVEEEERKEREEEERRQHEEEEKKQEEEERRERKEEERRQQEEEEKRMEKREERKRREEEIRRQKEEEEEEEERRQQEEGRSEEESEKEERKRQEMERKEEEERAMEEEARRREEKEREMRRRERHHHGEGGEETEEEAARREEEERRSPHEEVDHDKQRVPDAIL